MELINTLYAEYISDNQYVFYKEHNIIIIMKKLSDNMECVSDIEPKKYHSANLKVVLMFNLKDPYKLIYDLQKYKMNELISSYCYLSLEEAFTLHQSYYENGQKYEECNYINNKRNGLYQRYYMNLQKEEECNYIDDKLNGIYQRYHKNGQLEIKCHYINGIKS